MRRRDGPGDRRNQIRCAAGTTPETGGIRFDAPQGRLRRQET
ncbi:MAG: hypothetical protein AB9903_07435 [Vulcanimicrobiota bacterium]